MIFEVSRKKTIVISGVAVGSMLTVAYMAVQNGEPASRADLIPPVQLAAGTLSTATVSSSMAVISGYQSAISHNWYQLPPRTEALPRDGVTFPRWKESPPDTQRPRFQIYST